MSKCIDRAAVQKLGLAFLGVLHASIGRSHVVMRPKGTSRGRPPRRIFDLPQRRHPPERLPRSACSRNGGVPARARPPTEACGIMPPSRRGGQTPRD